ncbi:hypothetical protein DW1_1677 [Proteiniborus sp. DW1]|uniref:hypothetical protein n=1 Tax=Proteiniborus sp. DW1 TaxID=1889883 RepID=UPI00092DEEEB|nr:hypothetical protein [Proteiniborus sp. DW1]SCG83247.1 hypothetical protein DW1_1677 [Proteiniborus sp. DW1]
MKPLCFAVFVYDDYSKFIPFYIYSILKSYPEYYVKVFLRESLPESERRCMELIKEELSCNFEIKENYYSDFRFSDTTMRVLRFLIPYEEFKEFENVYIGDVDFLIVRETPSILDGHLKHCERIGLPYSNEIRPGTKRLSGLHFFKVKEYYSKMNKIIEYYLNNSDELYRIMNKLKSNEKFLYYIIEKEIGFGKLGQARKYRPHHGIHLSCEIEGYFENRKEASKARYNRLKKQLKEYFADPLFLEMIKILPVEKIVQLSHELQKYKDE